MCALRGAFARLSAAKKQATVETQQYKGKLAEFIQYKSTMESLPSLDAIDIEQVINHLC